MLQKIKKHIVDFSERLLFFFYFHSRPAYDRKEIINSELSFDALETTFGDQKGQVSFLLNNVFDYEKNGLKRKGFFIDLACADGVFLSNTHFLEKNLGWSGILFEPNPNFHEKVNTSRSSKLVTECVSSTANEVVDFRIDNGMFGGQVSDNFDNNAANRASQLVDAEVIKLRTTTLAAAMINNEAPKIIDFMSLDIEGGEWEALKYFPFDQFKFRCIAIERPSLELCLLLDKHEYRQVEKLSHDVIFVHADFIEDVNFSPRIYFSVGKKKDW